MKRSRVLNFKGFHSIIDFLLENKILIILSLFLFFGIFIGVFSYKKIPFFDELCKSELENFLTDRSNMTFFKIAVSSFFELMLWVVLLFIFGGSMFGIAILPFFVFLKGSLYGNTAAILYGEFALKGIAFHTVLVLPIAASFSLMLIFAARASMNFSFSVSAFVLRGSNLFDMPLAFREYCLKFLIFTVFVLLIAFADSLLSYNLLNIFSLEIN